MFLTVPSGTATSTEKSELYRAPSECSPDHFVNCGHHAGVARILLLRGAIGKTRSHPGSGEARGSPSRKSAGNIEPHLAKGSQKELQRIVERFGNRQHLDGVAIYNQKGAPIAVTTGLAHRLPDQPVVVAQAVSKGQGG